VSALRGEEALRGRGAQVDIRNESALREIVTAARPVACIHFAGLKAVGESVAKPLEYYDNNVVGTLALLRCLGAVGCRRLIFSSSATVYGSGSEPPFTEESTVGVGITNPYGWTKSMLEQIIRDWASAEKGTRVALLRYFNPVGAHASGRIGEDPAGPPNNLMPFVLQVAVGRRPHLTVFGGDYPTADGTAERDYIHVEDLAVGHLRALEWIEREELAGAPPATEAFNLGTGERVSVLRVVEAVRRASGRPVPCVVGDRRPGDLAIVYAKCDKAERVLRWRATKSLDDMCRDAWRWQSENPFGFRSEAEAAKLG
jgi:UDP-glucose 4-epimerase